MFLSSFHLNARRAGARKLLGSPQAMHAALLSGFPPGIDPGRVLWRVDDDTDPMRPVVFVASAHPLDATHIEEQGGWPSASTVRHAAYEPFLQRLEAGQTWAFRLQANPTHRASVHGAKKVLAHVTASQQMNWLHFRADGLGCDIGTPDDPTFTVTDRRLLRFRRGGSTVTLGVARFDGLLTVTDAARLRKALTEGIGRAKAYGCGLITLAKP